MLTWLKNQFLNRNRYRTSPQAVIIACFYNPLNSPYRLLAFQKWYRSIKHLNHRIIECLIGDQTKSQLPKSKFISQIKTQSLLWHKEALLNRVISELPSTFQYVFWLDTDVLFTNPNWLVEAVEQLQTNNLVQPFEYCVHLQRHQLKPDFRVDDYRATASESIRHPQLWRSFASNFGNGLARDTNYDRHGHVGFAWGARREILDQMSLYDKALIGGADHIMAHAAAGQIPHPCIAKSFTDNLEEVETWSKKFYQLVKGRIGFVSGDLYHIWHGDVQNRQYLKRIKDFTPEAKRINLKDQNGLYVKSGNNQYMKQYYLQREVSDLYEDDFDDFDDGFYQDMGYSIWDIINLFKSDQNFMGLEQFQDDPPETNSQIEVTSEPIPAHAISENFS